MESTIHQRLSSAPTSRPLDRTQFSSDTTLAWRSEVMQSLGLRAPGFQLAFGAAGLRTADSSGFMQYSDFIPPSGKVADVSVESTMNRSYAYGEMLRSLLPATESGLRGILGAKYRDWIACRNATPEHGRSRALFRVWANTVLEAERARAAVVVFEASCADPLTRASEAFADPRNRLPYVQRNGTIRELPFYSATYDHAFAAARRESLRDIRFDTGRVGLAAAEETLFFGNTGGVLDELGRRAASHRVTIRGRVGAWGKLATHPGNWCDEFELGRVWTSGDDPRVWDTEAETGGWSTFFGRNGLLAQRVGEIVVAAGMDLTVTSHARYTSAEAGKIAAHARRGVWPLVSNDGPPVHTQTLRHHANGSLSLRLQLAPDELQILGGYIQAAPY